MRWVDAVYGGLKTRKKLKSASPPTLTNKQAQMEQLNTLMKSTFKARHSKSPDYYIDFLNIACLLGGVRNGIHLDHITNQTLMKRIVKEIRKFKPVESNTRFETTIWNTEKVTNAHALNSWAYVGDNSKIDDSTYWANNYMLLGNEKGYPSYPTDPTKMGEWSLNLTLNYNGKSQYPNSMMGGMYDKTKVGDLDSIQVIQKFLESLVSMDMYNPSGVRVYLEKVALKIS